MIGNRAATYTTKKLINIRYSLLLLGRGGRDATKLVVQLKTAIHVIAIVGQQNFVPIFSLLL